MIGKLLLVVASVVGGIYLTSDEGKNARIAILKRKSAIEPIIKDLLSQANKALAGAEKVSAEDVRANINKLVNEARDIITTLDFDATLATIREAISVSSRKIRRAMDEVEKSTIKVTPRMEVTKARTKLVTRSLPTKRTSRGK